MSMCVSSITSKTCCIGSKMCWYGITSVIKEFFKACMLFVGFLFIVGPPLYSEYMFFLLRVRCRVLYTVYRWAWDPFTPPTAPPRRNVS